MKARIMELQLVLRFVISRTWNSFGIPTLRHIIRQIRFFILQFFLTGFIFCFCARTFLWHRHFRMLTKKTKNRKSFIFVETEMTNRTIGRVSTSKRQLGAPKIFFDSAIVIRKSKLVPIFNTGLVIMNGTIAMSILEIGISLWRRRP